jgi:ribosomal protein S18 acetylase RimI-like enzyme
MKIFDISTDELQTSNNFDQTVDFFVAKGYGPDKFVRGILKNTDCVFFVKVGDEIAGALRSISDHTRFTFIVDLIVSKKYRKQGLGTRLLKAAGNYYSNLKVHHIELTTDPSDPNLPEFYKKVGFIKDEGSDVFYYPWPKN